MSEHPGDDVGPSRPLVFEKPGRLRRRGIGPVRSSRVRHVLSVAIEDVEHRRTGFHPDEWRRRETGSRMHYRVSHAGVNSRAGTQPESNRKKTGEESDRAERDQETPHSRS